MRNWLQQGYHFERKRKAYLTLSSNLLIKKMLTKHKHLSNLKKLKLLVEVEIVKPWSNNRIWINQFQFHLRKCRLSQNKAIFLSRSRDRNKLENIISGKKNQVWTMMINHLWLWTVLEARRLSKMRVLRCVWVILTRWWCLSIQNTTLIDTNKTLKQAEWVQSINRTTVHLTILIWTNSLKARISIDLLITISTRTDKKVPQKVWEDEIATCIKAAATSLKFSMAITAREHLN